MFTIKNKSVDKTVRKSFVFKNFLFKSLLLLSSFTLMVFFSCASAPKENKTSSSSAAQKARDAANKGFLEETGEGIGLADIPESLPTATKPRQYDEPELIIEQNINTSTKQPAWVKNSQATFPAARYLSAVGSGRSTADAENTAIASIARIIKQNVSSNVLTREQDYASSDGKSLYQSSIDEIIETYSVVDALVGVKIAEFWWDKDDIVYALAYVDKQEAAQYYTKKLNENESAITEKIIYAKSQEGNFSSFTYALQALRLAEENEQYLDILHAMDSNAARQKTFSYGSIVSVKELSFELAQKISVDVSVIGDDDKRIQSSLTTMLTKLGFKTNTGYSKADYLLDAAVSFVEVPSAQNFYVRYIFSANLMEVKTGKTLLPYSDNKREGHIYLESAKERAIQSLLNTIQNEYASFFIDFLKE